MGTLSALYKSLDLSLKLNQIYYTFSTVMKTCVPLSKEKEKKLQYV